MTTDKTRKALANRIQCLKQENNFQHCFRDKKKEDSQNKHKKTYRDYRPKTVSSNSTGAEECKLNMDMVLVFVSRDQVLTEGHRGNKDIS